MRPLSNESLPNFMLSVCPDPTHFLTLTFRERSKHLRTPINSYAPENAVNWMLNRLNRESFGHGCKRKGYRCGSVVVLEKKESNVHAHLALKAPLNLNSANFKSRIIRLIKKGNWFGSQFDIQECTNPIGLYRYMAKEGQEALLLSCTHKANP
jgi:hypothetical protein